MNAASQLYSGTENETRSNSYKNLETFDVLLSRYRRALYQVASRVLDNHEEAEDAVQNCLRVASYNALRFESEGAFRSWLLRALIDEALTILHKERIRSSTSQDLLGTCSLRADGARNRHPAPDLKEPLLNATRRIASFAPFKGRPS